MLSVLVSVLVIALIGMGLLANPWLTIGIVAVVVLVMMFPWWALAIFAVFAAAFGLLWVKS